MCMTDLDHPLLNQAVRYILDGPHLSVLATIDPDGKPQTSVIFVKRDGDHILFSTIKGRRKTTNMRRDPRVNLLIHGLPVDRPNTPATARTTRPSPAPCSSPTTRTGRFTRRCTTCTWAAPPRLPSPERNE